MTTRAERIQEEADRMALQAIADLEHTYFLYNTAPTTGLAKLNARSKAVREALNDALGALKEVEKAMGVVRHGRGDETPQ